MSRQQSLVSAASLVSSFYELSYYEGKEIYVI